MLPLSCSGHWVPTERVKKRFKKKKKTKVAKNLLQGDSNPDRQNQLELKVNAPTHWLTNFSGSHTFSLTATAKIEIFVSPCPPECNFQSETKIEPDLRLPTGLPL